MKACGKKRGYFALSLLAAAINHAVYAADEPVELPAVKVTPAPDSAGRAPSVVEKYKLPQTTETTTAQKIADTVNIVDTEDAVKYMPSLFIRKRNYGDTQPVMATRTWGVGSSARSLVYADDVLLTALLANNNSIGAPRWGMVAPEEIQQIDVMYGPFAAAYPGNSMGAVMQITTRMPEKFEGSVSQTLAYQDYKQYKTDDTYRTSQTAATFGNRSGNVAWWLSANHQDSYSQPIAFVTQTQAAAEPAAPANTTGRIREVNKIGLFADVLGASILLHTKMDNAKVKLAWDVTPTLNAAYTLGYWQNHADASVQTYLTSTAPATLGQPTYGGQSGFATGTYGLVQEHTMQSLALKSNTRGAWDWEAVLTDYDMGKDVQNAATAVAAGTLTTLSPVGKTTVMDGTGWQSIDLKGIWRPNDVHEASFGLHDDQYKLNSTAYNTSNWTVANSYTGVNTQSLGKTRTDAMWVQDVFRFAKDFKATLGGRYEEWRAFDGYNFSSGKAPISQQSMDSNKFSPKASISWAASNDWIVTNSFGKAYRFPTVSELYQTVVSGATLANPNPNLKPEKVLSDELVFERAIPEGKLRVSLFQEDVSDAIISQTNSVAGTPTTYIVNVDKIRNRGIELAMQKNDVFTRGLELSGSVTYVDSEILADSTWVSPAAPAPQGTTAVGKKAPNVPDWRATVVATYRPNEKSAYTVAGRYSGRQYSTLDNTDVASNVYGSFDSFFVVDVRAHYQFDKHWDGSLGIDNLNNYKYTLYHPFPQRTVVGNLKYKF